MSLSCFDLRLGRLPAAGCFVCWILFQGVVNGQHPKEIPAHVEVTPAYHVVKVGDPITMLCKVIKPTIRDNEGNTSLRYCRIVVPGDPTAQIILPNLPPSPDKLDYHGAGLDKGECGFKIVHAKDIHNGVFTCFVNLIESRNEISANMTVVVARTPSPPEIVLYSSGTQGSGFVEDNVKDGDAVIVKCTVRDSRPPTKLTWYIGDELLEDGRSQQQVINVVTKDNLVTTEQNLTLKVDASYNGKVIKCIADHPGLDETNRQVEKRLIVGYPPKPLEEKVEWFGLVEGTQGRVPVVIEAYPRPTIKWNVGGMSIYEEETRDRFSVLKTTKQGFGSWETVLTINSLTKEDVSQSYSVKATNQYGETTYEVGISTSPQPETLPVGIGLVSVIIILALILLIIGGILFARAKGRWCFAGSQKVVPRIAGESSDTESADHSACEVKSKRSFVSAFKKGSDKEPTLPEETAEVEIEKPLAEGALERNGQNDSAAVNEPSNQSTDENGEGVVYAELNIQARNREGGLGVNVVRGEDDKTEYAEIIHTKSQPK